MKGHFQEPVQTADQTPKAYDGRPGETSGDTLPETHFQQPVPTPRVYAGKQWETSGRYTCGHPSGHHCSMNGDKGRQVETHFREPVQTPAVYEGRQGERSGATFREPVQAQPVQPLRNQEAHNKLLGD